MKISRRGKHTKPARRGRHTKRAGKHLRYKTKSKKFRASKRYHRGNKRTYKRGKRFHRGGLLKTYSVMFLVSKKGPYLEDEQLFTMTIELDKNIATVKLVRKDKQNIIFTIKGIYNDVRTLLSSPKDPVTLDHREVDFKKLDDDNNTGIYDFYRDGKNNPTFESIKTELDNLKVNVDFNNYDTSMPQHHFASSSLFVNSPEDTQRMVTSRFNRVVGEAPPTAAPPTAAPPTATVEPPSAVQAPTAAAPPTAQSTAIIDDGSVDNNHKEYRLPQYLGNYNYDNYLGRYRVKFGNLVYQMFDVYYTGALGRGGYRGGFIYLFGVTDADETNRGKLLYKSGYIIMTSTLVIKQNEKKNFLKMKDVYNADSTGKETYTLENISFIDLIYKKLIDIDK